MLTPQELAAGGVEIPTVNSDDLKRMYFQLQSSETEATATTIAYDRRALETLVQPASDPVAVFARATVIIYLQRSKLLDRWQTDGELQHIVYRKAAEFPLPFGMQSFEPDSFLAALNGPQ